MTTETTTASPIVTDDNQNSVTSPIVVTTPEPDPEPVTAEPALVASPEPTAAPTADKGVPDWMQKRINKITGEKYEFERLAQEAAERATVAENRTVELLKQIEKGGAPSATAAPQVNLSEAEIEKRALEKAQQIASANEFNKACNVIVDTGKKEFGATWDEAVKNLTLVGAIGDKVSPEFIETVIELKDPAKILHHLGTHMDEGARIAALPPKRMAMELARIEASLNAPPPPTPSPTLAPLSNAPPPVIPVGGVAKAGTPAIDDPNLSMAEWALLRARQVDEKRSRYRKA